MMKITVDKLDGVSIFSGAKKSHELAYLWNLSYHNYSTQVAAISPNQKFIYSFTTDHLQEFIYDPTKNKYNFTDTGDLFKEVVDSS